MSKLSHVDGQGRASMVDVSDKDVTARTASAEAIVVLPKQAFDLVVAGEVKKGDVLATARIAGIMAGKKTSDLIPLCHPLVLTHIGVEFTPLPDRFAFRIVATAKTSGQTGVEMEAMTAASVAALTVYDMVKAVDKGAMIETIRLLTKSGGKSGEYEAPSPLQALTEAPQSQVRRPKPAPRALMHEVAAPRPAHAGNDREAVRNFMQARRLRATEWAKSAAVPVNELYGYLSGHSRALSADSAERLANAARASVDEMFGRKGTR